jgi:hypothetical protein
MMTIIVDVEVVWVGVCLIIIHLHELGITGCLESSTDSL